MASQEHEPIHLMEALYESAVPDLVRANQQAQSEMNKMYLAGRHDIPEYMDLSLYPDFMQAKDGSLIDPKRQREIAKDVLAGLRESWNGTEPMENPLNPTYTEKYWEFVDVDHDFTPWTVVELYNNEPLPHQAGISAYIIAGATRPKAYQALLAAKERALEEADEKSGLYQEPAWQSEKTQPKSSRRQRAGKAIAKWMKNRADRPPRPNRFE